MKFFFRSLIALFLGVAASTFGQNSFYVYHSVGPVMFTNSAAFGFADGSLAGTNFFCGVYAGTDANSLLPQFSFTLGGLKHTFSSSGRTVMSGRTTVIAPPDASVVFQLRVWPSQFDTYEQALGSSFPTLPVGVSSLWPAIPANEIIELPIQTGLMWLAPIPEPSPLVMVALAGLLFGAGRFALRWQGVTESLLAGRH